MCLGGGRLVRTELPPPLCGTSFLGKVLHTHQPLGVPLIHQECKRSTGRNSPWARKLRTSSSISWLQCRHHTGLTGVRFVINWT